MKTVFALVGLVLVALPASGQSLRDRSRAPLAWADQQTLVAVTVQDRDHAERDALDHASWFYIATASADWSVTAVCARVMCGDKTQSGLFLRGVEPSWAIPLGLAIDAAIVVGVRELVAPEHPKLARVLLYGLGGAR